MAFAALLGVSSGRLAGLGAGPPQTLKRGDDALQDRRTAAGCVAGGGGVRSAYLSPQSAQSWRRRSIESNALGARMDQRIGSLSAEDMERLEKQRGWVRNHLTPDVQHKYETIEGKLWLLVEILEKGWIESDEKWKLQSLGITFGDALAQRLGLEWIMVEDEIGRDPALQDPAAPSTKVFPLTLISKRIENGEKVDVVRLYEQVGEAVADFRAQKPGRGMN